MTNTELTLIAAAVLAALYALTRINADPVAADPGTSDPFPVTDNPYTEPAATVDTPPAPTGPTFMESIMDPIRNVLGLWHPPAEYADLIAQTEQANNIPADMLARLLYQESHYRADVISGRTRSPVGALGIAQFMPATAADLGIDPLNTAQAIPAAGRYLAQLYRATGTWAQALAAYNWGIGNVQRKGIDRAPVETVNYYTQILRDVNASNGTAWA